MSKDLIKANTLLSEALATLTERGQLHDKVGTEERSLGKVAEMMTTLKGKEYTAEDIGLVQICVKLVRSQQGNYHHDNFVDLAGYAALTGEEAHRLHLEKESHKIQPYKAGDGVKASLQNIDWGKERDKSVIQAAPLASLEPVSRSNFIFHDYSFEIPSYDYVKVEASADTSKRQPTMVIKVGGELVPRMKIAKLREYLGENANPSEYQTLGKCILRIEDPSDLGCSYSFHISAFELGTEDKFLSLFALVTLLAEYLDNVVRKVKKN